MSVVKKNTGVNKRIKLARIILNKCTDLCDDMISVILMYIGYNNGIYDLRKVLMKECIYENYKQYRLQLRAMYCNKANEICNILYKKLSNYTVVKIAQIFPIVGKFHIDYLSNGKFHIDYLSNRIIKFYNQLCQKTLLRYDYELSMSYYNSAFRKALIHFLKFDYLELDMERKKYLPFFEEILGMEFYYA